MFDSRAQAVNNWDGTYKGEKAPLETYIYYMEYNGCDGVRYSRKGTINPFY